MQFYSLGIDFVKSFSEMRKKEKKHILKCKTCHESRIFKLICQQYWLSWYMSFSGVGMCLELKNMDGTSTRHNVKII